MSACWWQVGFVISFSAISSVITVHFTGKIFSAKGRTIFLLLESNSTQAISLFTRWTFRFLLFLYTFIISATFGCEWSMLGNRVLTCTMSERKYHGQLGRSIRNLDFKAGWPKSCSPYFHHFTQTIEKRGFIQECTPPCCSFRCYARFMTLCRVFYFLSFSLKEERIELPFSFFMRTMVSYGFHKANAN